MIWIFELVLDKYLPYTNEEIKVSISVSFGMTLFKSIRTGLYNVTNLFNGNISAVSSIGNRKDGLTTRKTPTKKRRPAKTLKDRKFSPRKIAEKIMQKIGQLKVMVEASPRGMRRTATNMKMTKQVAQMPWKIMRICELGITYVLF